tara:strand:- start:2245 stop:2505 length:261 start_codon:yes stop_codon:yes gene_type:complete
MAKNVNDHLTEMLGKKGSVEVFTTAAQTSKDFYAVYFPVDSVISAITVANCTGASFLHTTMSAGTTLFMNITAITLTSGVGVGYNN